MRMAVLLCWPAVGSPPGVRNATVCLDDILIVKLGVILFGSLLELHNLADPLQAQDVGVVGINANTC